MKAVQIKEYGGIDVLEVKDIPEPIPKENQLLVEVDSASINPVDWKIREGNRKERVSLDTPFTLGGDFSGIVKKAPATSQFKEGDEVYGFSLIWTGGSGSLAEFTASNEENTDLKPKTLDFTEAAGAPLVGASALQGIEEHIKLQSGQKILIHGGAGGIGSVAIQIAKAIGAYVATTVNTDDLEFAKEMGADEVIDYKNQKFEEVVKDYDAVFDTVGGEITNKSFGVLKESGVLVTMVGDPDQELAKEKGVTAIHEGTQTNTAHLRRLRDLIDSGKVKIPVDKTFSLDQIKEAFQYQEDVHPRGKVVITIKNR